MSALEAHVPSVEGGFGWWGESLYLRLFREDDPLTRFFREQGLSFERVALTGRASGQRIWSDEPPILDFDLRFGSNLFGHGNERFLKHFEAAQARHYGDGGTLTSSGSLELEARVARQLSDVLGMDKLQILLTGAQAVGAAVKACRRTTGRTYVVRFLGHYHGGGLADSVGLEGIQRPGTPDSDGYITIPWNDLDALSKVFEEYPGVIAGVMMEPIVASSGQHPKADYMKGVRTLCNHFGAKLILDEIITGFRARLGPIWPSWGEEARPDYVVLGKGLSGGLLPVGLLGGTAESMEVFHRGKVSLSGTHIGYQMLFMAIEATLASLLDEADCHERMESQVSRLKAIVEEGSRVKGAAIFVKQGCNFLSISADASIDERGQFMVKPHALAHTCLLLASLRRHGIYMNNNNVFVSTQLTDADIELFETRYDAVLDTFMDLKDRFRTYSQ